MLFIAEISRLAAHSPCGGSCLGSAWPCLLQDVKMSLSGRCFPITAEKTPLNQQQILEASNDRWRGLLTSITKGVKRLRPQPSAVLCAPPARGLVSPARDPTRGSPRPLWFLTMYCGREGRSGRRRRHLVPPGAGVPQGSAPGRGCAWHRAAEAKGQRAGVTAPSARV